MNQDFKEFFKSLNANGVEFLVIGGVAYNFYAPPRAKKLRIIADKLSAKKRP